MTDFAPSGSSDFSRVLIVRDASSGTSEGPSELGAFNQIIFAIVDAVDEDGIPTKVRHGQPQPRNFHELVKGTLGSFGVRDRRIDLALIVDHENDFSGFSLDQDPKSPFHDDWFWDGEKVNGSTRIVNMKDPKGRTALLSQLLIVKDDPRQEYSLALNLGPEVGNHEKAAAGFIYDNEKDFLGQLYTVFTTNPADELGRGRENTPHGILGLKHDMHIEWPGAQHGRIKFANESCADYLEMPPKLGGGGEAPSDSGETDEPKVHYYKSKMMFDPTVANEDSGLKHESAQWRPVYHCVDVPERKKSTTIINNEFTEITNFGDIINNTTNITIIVVIFPPAPGGGAGAGGDPFPHTPPPGGGDGRIICLPYSHDPPITDGIEHSTHGYIGVSFGEDGRPHIWVGDKGDKVVVGPGEEVIITPGSDGKESTVTIDPLTPSSGGAGANTFTPKPDGIEDGDGIVDGGFEGVDLNGQSLIPITPQGFEHAIDVAHTSGLKDPGILITDANGKVTHVNLNTGEETVLDDGGGATQSGPKPVQPRGPKWEQAVTVPSDSPAGQVFVTDGKGGSVTANLFIPDDTEEPQPVDALFDFAGIDPGQGGRPIEDGYVWDPDEDDPRNTRLIRRSGGDEVDVVLELGPGDEIIVKPAGTPDGYVPVADTEFGYVWEDPAASSGANFGVFGDGSDGSADLDGTNTVDWASKVGSVYTMSRDAFLEDLIVRDGVSLEPNGFRLYGTGLLAVEATGEIVCNGDAGADGGAGCSNATGTLKGGASGGAAGDAGTTTGPATGNGATGGVTTGGESAGGQGGAGAQATAGGVGLGGVGGTASFSTQYGNFRSAPTVTTGAVYAQTGSGLKFLQGGGGGAGGGIALAAGGTDLSHVAGRGGGGGGVMVIVFHTIENEGTISANGGDGEDTPAVFGSGNVAKGGGGGGGGGAVLGVCRTYTGNAPTATGGAAGASDTHGTGSITSASQDGFDGNVVLIFG